MLQAIANLQKIPNEGAIAAATPCPSNESPVRLDTVMAIQERNMSVLVSDEILRAANMSDADLKRELAILLYQQKKLGISKARELAEMPLIEFQRELAQRQIPVFDDLAGFEAKIEPTNDNITLSP